MARPDAVVAQIAPHSPEAERAVVGAGIYSVEALRAAEGMIGPQDFYLPALGAVFDAACRLDRAGEAVSPHTVAAAMAADPALPAVGGLSGLLALTAEAPSVSNARYLCATIIEHAARRRLLDAAMTVREGVGALLPPESILDRARADLDAVPLGAGTGLPPGVLNGDDWLGVDVDQSAPWVVTGMIRRSWRMIFVADPGAGKSWLTTQMAVKVAQGLHPFTEERVRVEPRPTLVIDAENPYDAIQVRLRRLLSRAHFDAKAWYDPDRFHLMPAPGGIDLRSVADRRRVEATLRATRPDLVVMGPLYKLFRRRPNEDHEEAALDCQNVLDDLRTRYGFALVIEAHAPHGELRVRGSAAWGGWPEVGHGLRVSDAGDFTVEPFRGDRIAAAWPGAYRRGGNMAWPWIGVWDDNDGPKGQGEF